MPSLPISPEIPIGLFEMRLLGTMLPPLSPSRLKAVVERPYPACYKYLFLPLLDSLLIISPTGHFGRLQFCLSSVRCSLYSFFMNPLRSSIFYSLDFLLLALTDDVDQVYSTAQRMKHGGHHNEGIHRDHYQPNNTGTNLQDALFGGQLRTIAADLFRSYDCVPQS